MQIIKIEGVDIIIDVYEDSEDSMRADFCAAISHAAYIAAGRNGENPWEELIGFNRPMAALRIIGEAVLKMANGKKTWLEGSDERRTSVYSKMLRRAGVRHSLEKDSYGDLAIRVN